MYKTLRSVAEVAATAAATATEAADQLPAATQLGTEAIGTSLVVYGTTREVVP